MRHIRIEGSCSRERLRAAASVGLPELMPPVDAHRRLRGPYTAAGTILRGLIPGLLQRRPELVQRHDIEVLSASPELRGVVQATRETLTSLAEPDERTRFYSRLRTLRIAHGLTELIADGLDDGPRRTLVIDNAHRADPTDAELIGVLLRRIDPALLTLIVCTAPDTVAHPGLEAALARHADTRTARPEPEGRPTGDDADLAYRYVESDCVSDEPALVAAYKQLSPDQRATLHDQRADYLEGRGELSLRLGAIPFHREQGSDPARAGAQALRFALDYCIDLGFYDATVGFGERGRAVIDRAGQANPRWTFTTMMNTSLAALGRPEEAEAPYGGSRKTVSGWTAGMDAAVLADTAWHGGLLLGRDREIATLTHALDEVRDGSALVVEILAEPGMGKTRLLVELAGLARTAGVRMVASGGGGHARALESALVEVLDVQLAGLASQLLGGLPAHRHPSALRTLLGRLASVPPLVLAIDDAHSADEQALDLICELLHWPPSAPLLLVLALRPHQTPARLRQALDGASGVYHLPLAALTVAETAALAGLPATQDADLAQHGASSGNPFYVKALAALPPPYGPHRASAARGLSHQVGAAVAVEIGTLTPDARLAAHAAAVLGDPVDPYLVAEVAELPADHVYRAIDELVDRDILRPAPDDHGLTFRHPVFRRLVYQDSRPGWRLRAHRLADQALRDRDAPAVTRAAHLAHTTSEEAVWVLADAAEAVASHQPELAARWLLAALRQVSAGADVAEERATLLTRLRGVVSRARFGPGRSRILHEALRLLPDRPSSLRLTVHVCSAQLERVLRRPAQARRVARAGMAELSGDHLADKQTAAALALELACAYLSHRFTSQSRTHAEYALAAAREHGDRALQTCATGVAAVARCLAGESSDANDEVDQAAQAVDVLTDCELSQRLDAALWVGVGHVLLDRPEEALRRLDRAVEVGAGAEVHITSLYLHFCRAMALRSVGRLADATAAALAAHDLAASAGSAELLALTVALRGYLSSWTDDDPQSGDRPGVAWSPPEVAAAAADAAGPDPFATFELGMRAEARLAAGDHDGCISLLLDPEGPDPSQVDPWSRVAWYELLTRAALLARRYDDADRWAGLAESVAARLGAGGRIGLGALARAQALAPSAPAAAATLAGQAAESLTASGLVLDAARARAVVGVALAGSGKIDRAIAELAVAERLFSQYGARRSERKVAEQRRRMDTRIRSGPIRNGVAALTARELQVATLVTEGLTNRQVAARLFVTVKTVEMHLSHVFVKLGVSNRVGLVREVALAGA